MEEPSKVFSPGYGHAGHRHSICAAQSSSQGRERDRRSSSCMRGPCHRNGEEKRHFPSHQALLSRRLFREGRGHSPMCLEVAALPPGRCSWRGGAELHAIPQHSPNEALTPWEQRAEPPSCSPALGFWHKGFELGICWFH